MANKNSKAYNERMKQKIWKTKSIQYRCSLFRHVFGIKQWSKLFNIETILQSKRVTIVDNLKIFENWKYLES